MGHRDRDRPPVQHRDLAILQRTIIGAARAIPCRLNRMSTARESP
jgi:hypothetical protein